MDPAAVATPVSSLPAKAEQQEARREALAARPTQGHHGVASRRPLPREAGADAPSRDESDPVAQALHALARTRVRYRGPKAGTLDAIAAPTAAACRQAQPGEPCAPSTLRAGLRPGAHELGSHAGPTGRAPGAAAWPTAPAPPEPDYATHGPVWHLQSAEGAAGPPAGDDARATRKASSLPARPALGRDVHLRLMEVALDARLPQPDDPSPILATVRRLLAERQGLPPLSAAAAAAALAEDAAKLAAQPPDTLVQLWQSLLLEEDPPCPGVVGASGGFFASPHPRAEALVAALRALLAELGRPPARSAPVLFRSCDGAAASSSSSVPAKESARVCETLLPPLARGLLRHSPCWNMARGHGELLGVGIEFAGWSKQGREDLVARFRALRSAPGRGSTAAACAGGRTVDAALLLTSLVDSHCAEFQRVAEVIRAAKRQQVDPSAGAAAAAGSTHGGQAVAPVSPPRQVPCLAPASSASDAPLQVAAPCAGPSSGDSDGGGGGRRATACSDEAPLAAARPRSQEHDLVAAAASQPAGRVAAAASQPAGRVAAAASQPAGRVAAAAPSVPSPPPQQIASESAAQAPPLPADAVAQRPPAEGGSSARSPGPLPGGVGATLGIAQPPRLHPMRSEGARVGLSPPSLARSPLGHAHSSLADAGRAAGATGSPGRTRFRRLSEYSEPLHPTARQHGRRPPVAASSASTSWSRSTSARNAGRSGGNRAASLSGRPSLGSQASSMASSAGPGTSSVCGDTELGSVSSPAYAFEFDPGLQQHSSAMWTIASQAKLARADRPDTGTLEAPLQAGAGGSLRALSATCSDAASRPADVPVSADPRRASAAGSGPDEPAQALSEQQGDGLYGIPEIVGEGETVAWAE